MFVELLDGVDGGFEGFGGFGRWSRVMAALALTKGLCKLLIGSNEFLQGLIFLDGDIGQVVK